jgi:hypothetical protein
VCVLFPSRAEEEEGLEAARRDELEEQGKRVQEAKKKKKRGKAKCKIIVVGDPGTGKAAASPFVFPCPQGTSPLSSRCLNAMRVLRQTSLISQYVYGKFDPSQAVTIGVEMHTRTIKTAKNKSGLELQICDMVGQDRSRVLSRALYANAVGAVVVVDVTNPGALNEAQHWKMEIDDKATLADGKGSSSNPAGPNPGPPCLEHATHRLLPCCAGSPARHAHTSALHGRYSDRLSGQQVRFASQVPRNRRSGSILGLF